MYLVEIKNRAIQVENFINKIQNPAAKNFYNSVLGKLFLFDYNNQFDLKLKDKLHSYIENTNQDKDYNLKSHEEYMHTTLYCREKRNDCDRRIGNIKLVINKYKDLIDPPIEDVFFDFSFVFDKEINQWKIFPGDVMPEIPPATGNQYFFLNTAKYNYFFIPASHEISYKFNHFYYSANEKKLYYINSDNTFPLLKGCSENDKKWSTLSLGLSPRQPKPFLELPDSINQANYVVYNIQVKYGITEIKDLFQLLKNAIIDALPFSDEECTYLSEDMEFVSD